MSSPPGAVSSASHASLVRDLDRELEESHGLPLTHYEVLLHLANAPDDRLRMSDLAGSVLLSQSGVTRLVDRIEKAGLVVREPCPEDRRVLYARLTDVGQVATRRRAADAPRRRAGTLPRHFEPPELVELAAAWERLRPGVTA